MRVRTTHFIIAVALFLLAALPSPPLVAQPAPDIVFSNHGLNRVCLNDGSGSFVCSDVDPPDTHNSGGVALGDFDGLNGLDLAFAGGGPQTNRLCLNDGSGSFVCSDVNSDTNTTVDVEVADFDGVNGPDLAFVNDTASQTNRVCLNDGSAGFICSDISSETADSEGLAVGDFDGVNGPDIVIANNGHFNWLCLNDGFGAFNCSNLSTDLNTSRSVAVGDFDSSNGLDIVFGNTGPNRVCLNDGSAGFVCTDVSGDTFNSEGVAVANMDSANGPDILFANTNAPNRLCLNNGLAQFTCSNISSDTNDSYDVAVGDLDGANELDLVIANSATEANRICLSSGSGAFTCTDAGSGNNDTREVAIGDFGGPPLPVELTSFTAAISGSNVNVAWTTASETNNAGFEVQLRVTGEYEAVGFVDGHGTTTVEQSYAYTIQDVVSGAYTIRLKQIDFDGAFEYSPEIEVVVGVPGTHVLTLAYPNPFNPQASFSLSVAAEQHVEIGLYNVLGRRVQTLFSGTMVAGEGRVFTIDGGHLPSGTYYYRASGETFSDIGRATLLR